MRRFFQRTLTTSATNTKPQPVEIIDTTPFYWKILKNPFKSYTKMASLTFGMIFFGNLMTTLTDINRRNFMIRHSQAYSLTLLTKSFWFATLWPGYIITALVDPRSVFVLGHGIGLDSEHFHHMNTEIEETSKVLNDFNDVIIKIETRKEFKLHEQIKKFLDDQLK